MEQDVGIVERQQGRDDHKTVKYRNLLHIFFVIHILWKEIPVGDCILDCFMIIPTLFLYFLPFCYPYILLPF